MAIPFIEHSYIGKATQKEPGTAVAHLRYITRKQATHYVGSNLSTNYHKVTRELAAREQRTRKNGRVIDKFVIALPREMTMEQAVRSLHTFGHQLTEDRAWYLFSIQDWNQNNPHCHFILVDEDRETHKRVFGVSRLDSTARVKRLWQDVANDDMAALGIDARIDFDAAEERAQQLREQEANDNERQSENDAPLEAQPAEEAATLNPDSEVEEPIESTEPIDLETEDADDGDEDMADATLELYGPPLRNALYAHQEVSRLRNIQERIGATARQLTRLAQELEKAEGERGRAEHAQMLAEQAINPAARAFGEHTTNRGKLKGWAIGFGRFKVKTRARQEAELAALRYHSVKSHLEEAKREYDAHDFEAKRHAARIAEYERKSALLKRELATYGVGKDLDMAERVFENTIRKNLEKVPLKEMQAAYARGELNEYIYREFLFVGGHRRELDELEDAIEERDKDRSEGY